MSSARHLSQDAREAPQPTQCTPNPEPASTPKYNVFWFYVPYPKPARARTIPKPGNAANNADIWATQTRSSTGATYEAPPKTKPHRDDWWGNQRWADETENGANCRELV